MTARNYRNHRPSTSVAQLAAPARIAVAARVTLASRVAALLIATGALFAVAWPAAAQTSVSQTTGRQPAPTQRDMEESVLFERMPGSTLDSLDRVEFRVVDDRIVLGDVWFERRPYDLSDGLLLPQTGQYESELYVRQIIEHPLAKATVVVYPGESTDRSTTISRFLSFVELSQLNEGRSLTVASEFEDGVPDVSAQSLSEALENGASAADLAGWLGTRGIRTIAVPHLDLPEQEAPQQVVVAPVNVTYDDIRDAAELLIDTNDESMASIMQAQVMDVVLYLEYAIHRSVEDAGYLSNNEIDRINNLEIEFSVLVGRADPADLIFPDRSDLSSRVRNILARMDRITDGDVVAAFDTRIRAVRDLLGGGLVDSLHGALEEVVANRPDAEVSVTVPAAAGEQLTPEEADALQRREQMSAFVRDRVDSLPSQSVSIVVGSRETAYELIQLSLESSAFNVVLMSEARPSTGDAEMVIERQPDLLHPDLPRLVSADNVLIRRLEAFAEAHLETAIAGTEEGTVLITQSTVDALRTLVTVFASVGGNNYRLRHYLLPGTTPEQLVAAAQSLTRMEDVDELESALIYRWAIVAQTALEL